MKKQLLPAFNRLTGLVTILFAFCLNSFAQPSNDDPCNAIPLSVTNTCNYEVFTTIAATASAGVPAPGCANYNGGDVWFSVTVPCEGRLNIDTDDGGITDGGMAVYSGDCSALTLIECDDDGSQNGLMSYIALTGLTPGSTLYIRVWEYGNDNPGTFGICVTTPPPPGPGGSCITAQPFCTSNQYTFPNATDIPDGGGGGIYGCLGTTPNPVWYYMQVATAGNIEITIEQTTPSGVGIDVDYIVWGPFTTLQMSCPGLSASNIVSCSYSVAPIEVATIPNAQVGEFYMMLITNYANQAGTITFQQTAGTGATTCAIICNVTAGNSGPVCPGQNFNLNASTITNATYSWVGPNCWTSTQQNPTGIPAPTMPGSYTYTVTAVTPAGTSCSASTTVVVGSSITATSSTTSTSCAGASNGTITVTPSVAGTYTYTLNPGNIVQSSPTFTGLAAGSYSVTYTNAAGCSGVLNNITVTPGAAPTGTATATPSSCPSATDGTITVTPTGGAPYSFTLMPGAITQASPTFTGLAAGTYNITFTNGSGCTGTVSTVTVTSGTNLTGTAAPSPTSCAGATDGSITVTPGTAGTYTYTLNPGGITQASPTFTGLATGTYSVTFTNSQGCSGTVNNITITAGTTLTGTAAPSPTSCAGATDGSITVTANGTGPFTYVLNPGAISQSTPTFTGLAAGTYSVTFSNSLGCSGTINNITVSQGTNLSGTATPTATSCAGASNGSIVVAVLGTGPFTYVLNPGNISQSTGTFTGLAQGAYTISFSNALGCSGTVSATVNTGPAITATAATTAPTCAGASNGSVTVTPGTAGTYTYTLNPGAISQASPTFNNLAPGAYTITLANALGCSGTVNASIAPGPALTATANTTAPTCSGASNGSITVTPGTAGTYTYTLNPGGISQASATFNNLAAGAYTLTYSNSLGCSGTVNANIAAGPALTATAAPTAPTCSGAANGSITVTTGTPGTYTYTLNPGGISQPSPTFNNLTAGAYTITYTNALGCTGTVNSTVAAGPALTATSTTIATTCPGVNNGSLTVTPGTAGTYTYTLNPGAISQASNTFSNLAAGTYAVTYTNSLGCTGTLNNITVAQGAAPTATFTTTAPSCSGVNDGTITITTNAAAPVTYTLNPGGITQAGSTFTNLAPGTYSVSYSNAIGCSGTVNNITVAPGAPLTATATTTATSCPTVINGTITVTPGGTGPYIFTLNPGNVVQASNVFTNMAPGTYTITFVTAAGCTGSVTTNPVVNAGPAITSTSTVMNPPCSGINNGSITIVPGGTAPYSFVLNGPGGPYTQAIPVFSNLAPGTYNYTFTDASGCQGSGSATLTTNPPIISPVTIVNPLCNGGNNGSAIFNTSGGVAPYQYSLNGGSTYQTSSTITGLTAGSHPIRIRDNFGCIKDTIITLTQPPVLTASATSTNAGCGGNDGSITVAGSGGTAPYSYSIDNGTNWQPSATFTVSTGTYNNIRVRDANGCIANTNVVVGLTDNMFLEIGPGVTICAESSHTFDVQTNPETNVFSWTSSPASPGSIDNPAIKNPTVDPLQTVTYTLNATWGACTRTDQVTIEVLLKPVPNAGEDVWICQLDSTLLSATVTNVSGTVNYSWSPAADVRDPLNPVTWAVADTTTLYIVTVTDNYGCNFSVNDSVLVTMQPPVPAFAGNDTIAIWGVPHQLMGSGGTSYSWSPSAPLDNPFAAQPMATLTQDTKFTLIVEDFVGCIGYDTVFVKVYEGPTYYVPNAFTPNGDGLNDIFRAIPVGIASTEWFRVFNRYGQVVFETNQWLKGWDGRFKGKDQPMGVYIWIVKGKDRLGRVVEEKGTVTLLR